MKKLITSIGLGLLANFIVIQLDITLPPYIICIGWIACTLNDMLNAKK